jgi:hypothetical protein
MAMVERLFSSRTLFRTLALFFRYPEEPLNPRLISRYTGADVKCVHRELKKLKEIGIVRGYAAGRYRYYTLDIGHPVHEELRSIFARTRREWEHATRPPCVRMREKWMGRRSGEARRPVEYDQAGGISRSLP